MRILFAKALLMYLSNETYCSLGRSVALLALTSAATLSCPRLLDYRAFGSGPELPDPCIRISEPGVDRDMHHVHTNKRGLHLSSTQMSTLQRVRGRCDIYSSLSNMYARPPPCEDVMHVNYINQRGMLGTIVRETVDYTS